MPSPRSRSWAPFWVSAGTVRAIRLPAEGGHLDAPAEEGDTEWDGDADPEVVPVAGEGVVGAQPHLDQQVAGRPAVRTRAALAGGPHFGAVLDPRRDADLHPAGAGRAGQLEGADRAPERLLEADLGLALDVPAATG